LMALETGSKYPYRRRSKVEKEKHNNPKIKMAPKRKQVSGSAENKTMKKQAIALKRQYVIVHPKPFYPKHEKRRKVLKANLKEIGCRPFLELPWEWTINKMLKEIVNQKTPTPFQDTFGTIWKIRQRMLYLCHGRLVQKENDSSQG
jgi:hypothetical protein